MIIPHLPSAMAVRKSDLSETSLISDTEIKPSLIRSRTLAEDCLSISKNSGVTAIGLITASLIRAESTNPSIWTTNIAMPGPLPNLNLRITRSLLFPNVSLMRDSFSLRFLLSLPVSEIWGSEPLWLGMAERCLLGTMRKTSLDNARKTICPHPLKIKIPIAIIASYGKPYPRANRWLGRVFQGRVVFVRGFRFFLR